MTNILGIGIATVDVINVTQGYPNEDDEVRAINRRVQRGGNVCNTLVVLSQLGNQCRWAGTLGDDTNARVVIEDLLRFDVDAKQCTVVPHGVTPSSYITLNAENGSRTIVHYRDLTELSYENFQTFQFDDVQWCHFEGRNIPELHKMLGLLKNTHPNLPYSVEIEKPRDQIESIIEGARIAFFSKKYAESKGYQSAPKLLEVFAHQHTNTQLVCTWGKQGAYAIDENQHVIHQPAAPLTSVIDSIGAGDTFIAGFLHQWWKTQDIHRTLAFATTLAAKKCAQYGFEGLVTTSA